MAPENPRASQGPPHLRASSPRAGLPRRERGPPLRTRAIPGTPSTAPRDRGAPRRRGGGRRLPRAQTALLQASPCPHVWARIESPRGSG
eukprot:4536432-Alexandrium_andersonii.AAC.1